MEEHWKNVKKGGAAATKNPKAPTFTISDVLNFFHFGERFFPGNPVWIKPNKCKDAAQ